jgi:hypothetical protein
VTVTAQGWRIPLGWDEAVTPRARDHAKIETQKITTSRRIDLWKEVLPQKASHNKKTFLKCTFSDSSCANTTPQPDWTLHAGLLFPAEFAPLRPVGQAYGIWWRISLTKEAFSPDFLHWPSFSVYCWGDDGEGKWGAP